MIVPAIQLQPFGPADYAALISWVESPELLMQYAGPAFTFPLTGLQLDLSAMDPARTSFKVVEAATGVALGHAELYLNPATVCLGRILIGDPQRRNKGLGKQIVQLLLEEAFSATDRGIAELNVFDWNAAAIRCYERMGFTINPAQRLERRINGATWTAVNMRLAKKEWKAQPAQR